jgi:hypothetical protein
MGRECLTNILYLALSYCRGGWLLLVVKFHNATHEIPFDMRCVAGAQ